MPFIDSKITVAVDAAKKEELKAELGKLMATLHKSESYLMVGIEDKYDLWLGGKKLDFFSKFSHLPWIFRGEVEKLHRGHAKVFADVKERGHGRERLPRLDGIDIARALAEGKAHIAGGYALLHTELRKAHGKVLLIHGKHLVSNHIRREVPFYLISHAILIDM